MTAAATIWTELAPYVVMILVGFLPNEVWRMLGVVAARGIDENSQLLVWVKAVATATLTGVVAKIIIFAPGALADIPLWVRIVAVAVGLLAYVATRLSVIVGVLVGTAVILAGAVTLGI